MVWIIQQAQEGYPSDDRKHTLVKVYIILHFPEKNYMMLVIN